MVYPKKVEIRALSITVLSSICCVIAYKRSVLTQGRKVRAPLCRSSFIGKLTFGVIVLYGSRHYLEKYFIPGRWVRATTHHTDTDEACNHGELDIGVIAHHEDVENSGETGVS